MRKLRKVRILSQRQDKFSKFSVQKIKIRQTDVE